MRPTKAIAALLVTFAMIVGPIAPTRAAIHTQDLGAKYDATNSNITFRVYSSRVTRIELDLFAVSYGAPEVAKYLLTEDASDVWSVTVPVSAMQAAGINGPVFYGYRAWGPNWPYSPSWTKGSSAGFITDVDGSGNRFNPNKLLFDPYARELSHDPLNPSNSDPTVFAYSFRLGDVILTHLGLDGSPTGNSLLRAPYS
jgi:isoamylase